jgi:RNA polymerase sigma-70 factor (ECF subfamily)
MAELDEEQGWIRKSQDGDHEAFEALVTRHQRVIHSVAYRMTGSLADAEDLAQQTFIQAFRQLGAYRAEAKFSSWLYRIVFNLALNWKKHQDSQQRLISDWGREQMMAASDPGFKRSQQVQEALLKLNPKQRAAIILTVYDGLNHAEAALVLGCSETTVSWRIFTARAKLKKLLSNPQAEDVSHD